MAPGAESWAKASEGSKDLGFKQAREQLLGGGSADPVMAEFLTVFLPAEKTLLTCHDSLLAIARSARPPGKMV